MKVLFLDIDGVLNSRRSQMAFGAYPHDFSNMQQFDLVAVSLIRRLCRVTDCSVVLSSDWRYSTTAHLAANALDLPIMGVTPQLKGTRGLEINAWLSEHPEVTRYAIVDDIAQFMDHQRPFFVQTDDAFGLTLRNYSELAAILNRRIAA
jgi:hypothetical protein